MIKKLILAAIAIMAFGAVDAKAGELYTDVGYSSMSVVGVVCSTGTVMPLNATRPAGFSATPGGYRVMNQDATNAVWIGGISVSTHAATAAALANLGEKIAAGGNAPYSLGKSYDRSTVPLAQFYCRAADACGAAGCLLSVVWFGY